MAETFGEIIMRLLPKGVPLTELSHEVRVGYDWLHNNVKGGKRASKSGIPLAMGEKALDALERLGANVTARDREAMMTACVDFKGVGRAYRVVQVDMPLGELAPDALRVAEAYQNSPEPLKRAFDSLAEAVPRPAGDEHDASQKADAAEREKADAAEGVGISQE